MCFIVIEAMHILTLIFIQDEVLHFLLLQLKSIARNISIKKSIEKLHHLVVFQNLDA